MKLLIDIPEDSYRFILQHGIKDTHEIDEVIANGTPYNPTGDCISREALRKAFHERIYYFNKSSWDEANAIIDNAPTVPLPNEQIAWEQGYEAGLAQGKQDRPQGEWKFVERDNQDIDIVCPFCNSIRFPAYSHGYALEELEEYLIRHHLPNFCEDCGADMRGGKE